MNNQRNTWLFVFACVVLVVSVSGLQQAGSANTTDSLDINDVLQTLQSPEFASKNISQLLQLFPTFAAQNVSQLIKQFAPPSSRGAIQTVLGFVPQIASQNLTQLLQYFPQIATQNVSQLMAIVPEVLSNTTELEEIFKQVVGAVQKYANQTTGSQHGAFSAFQNMMNIPQLLSNGLSSFKLTPATLIALSEQLKNNGVGQTCNGHFIATIVGLNWTQIWAMEMIDAMGKPPAYLRSFNFQWLGDYQECKDVNATTYNGQNFRGQYCKVELGAPAALVKAIVPEAGAYSPSFKIGVCIPDSCTTGDLRGLANTVSGLISGGNQSYDGEVSCKVEDNSLTGGAIAVICILSLIGFLMAAGTLYDVITVQVPSRRNASTSSKANGVTNLGFIPTDSNGHVVNGHLPSSNGHVDSKVDISMKTFDVIPEPTEHGSGGKYVLVTQPTPVSERSAIERVLLAFSAYTNGVKLLNTYQPKGAIESINGIRFLSMAWVILGHTVLFYSGAPENQTPYTLKKIEQWTFYAYYSATVSVDSFFTLSGLLVGYLTLQQLKKSQGAKKMNWFMFYFHRFWRLTPPYMLVIMVLTELWQKMGDGPMWPENDWSQAKFCRKNWWVNLLYVNNYVRVDEMCMGWSWYLANDMMFYILSPLIVVPFFYNLLAGGIMAGIFFLATTIAAGAIAKKHEYTALFLSIIGPRPKDADYMKVFYIPAHTRMGPYIVGLVAGYILYRYKDQIRNKMSKLVAVIGWLLCFTIISLVIYGVYPDHDTHFLSVDESVAYISLHRSAWGIALSWIIIACYTGHGGWINELLSWKAFVPLGRLTYCAYLVHPIVINVFYMSQERLIYLTDNAMAYMFSANIALSFAVAFLTSLAFESPMMGLEKVIFNKDKRN